MKIRQRFNTKQDLIAAVRKVVSSRPDLRTFYVNTTAGELIDLDPRTRFQFADTFSPCAHGRALWTFLDENVMHRDWKTPRSYRYENYTYYHPESGMYEDPKDSEYRRFYDLSKFHNFIYNPADYFFPLNITAYADSLGFRVHPGTYRELALVHYWTHRPETKIKIMITDACQRRQTLIEQLRTAYGDRLCCIRDVSNQQLAHDLQLDTLVARGANIEVEFKVKQDRFDGFCITELHAEQMQIEHQTDFEISYDPHTKVFYVNGDPILVPYCDLALDRYRLTTSV